MRKLVFSAVALALASSAFAAPNVTNATQKGSLLIWTDIRVDNSDGNLVQGFGPFNTLIRLQNDGSSDVDVKCYWMDGHKNRVDFIIPVTKNQAVWFDAATGRGSINVNPFPGAGANGFTVSNRHPFLEAGGAFDLPGTFPNLAQLGTSTTFPNGDGYGPYRRGLLACWAVDGGAQNQVKWNHLSGTATVYGVGAGGTAYEYNAYAFFVPTGTDLQPVGVAGTLNLNGLEYDACPLYQIGQFTPGLLAGIAYNAIFQLPAPNTPPLQPTNPPLPLAGYNRLAIVGCNLNLNQDWAPVWTKLQFDVWNEEEVKYTGAFECADSWHETDFRPGFTPQNNGVVTPGVPGFVDGMDAAGQNFDFATLASYAARYRVQGVKSPQCDRTKSGANDNVAAVSTVAVGVIGVQSSFLSTPGSDFVGTTLAAAGKFNGKIVWDPEGAVPEGGVR